AQHPRSGGSPASPAPRGSCPRPPRLHPPGCVDVDSERAPVDEGDAEIHEGQQGRRQPARLLDGYGELLGRLQNGRAMRVDLGRVEDGAEELALPGEDLLEGRIATVILDLPHSGHGRYLIRAA